MLDHIGLRTRDLPRLERFYEAALAPLGHTKLTAWDGGAGFGSNAPTLWLGVAEGMVSSMHLALNAKSRDEVDGFHAAALAAGARDNGAPGIRINYHPGYYAAFVIDPDGNNIEAVFHETATN